MGRGRQKAKHTKVARELKYFSPDTNYNALERELTPTSTAAPVNARLEEDLEKWPEFSASSDFSGSSDFKAPSEYSDSASEYSDAYGQDDFGTGHNKSA